MTAATEITTATDPVCGMTVDPATTPHRHSHGGRDYYFCSAGCQKRFSADPQRYLDKIQRSHGHGAPHGHGAQPPAPAKLDAIYTCPMHPEIRQIGPGTCPICGMALEPVDAAANAPN